MDLFFFPLGSPFMKKASSSLSEELITIGWEFLVTPPAGSLLMALGTMGMLYRGRRREMEIVSVARRRTGTPFGTGFLGEDVEMVAS